MPTVLPPSALLVSRSPQGDQGVARVAEPASPHIKGNAKQARGGKFADVLQSAAAKPVATSTESKPQIDNESAPSPTQPANANTDTGADAAASHTDGEPQRQLEAEVEPLLPQPPAQTGDADVQHPSSDHRGPRAHDLNASAELPPTLRRAGQPTEISTPAPVVIADPMPAESASAHPSRNEAAQIRVSDSPPPVQGASNAPPDQHIIHPTSASAGAPVIAVSAAPPATIAPAGNDKNAAAQAPQPPNSNVPPSQQRDSHSIPVPVQNDEAPRPAPGNQQHIPLRAPSNAAPQRQPATPATDLSPFADRTAAPDRTPSVDLTSSVNRTTSAERQPVPALRVEVQQPQVTPAVARALHVDAAVRLEHATTQAMPGDQLAVNHQSGSQTAHQSALGPSLQLKSDNLAQQLPWTGAGIDESPLSGQVVRSLATMVNQRGGTMNLRLDPPDLGQLRIQMTVARGVVTAEFHPTTPQAHHLLEQNLAALRSTLEGQGLTVERLNVHVASPAGQQMMRDDSNANTGHQHRQQHDAAGGESRGRRDGQHHEFHREYAFADFDNLLSELDQFALR